MRGLFSGSRKTLSSDVKLSNGILVVSFKRPVDVSVNRLDTNARGYVSAARRDPDGTAVRIALSQKVTVNSMAAGERLFVDLLPESWKGVPPGLPQEVVEELAKRARDAEKKIREQRLLAEQRQLPVTRVRLSNQPTFSRYVFDLPDLIAVSTDRGKDKFTLVFDAPLKFDLGDAIASQPPMVQKVETSIDNQTTKVAFTFNSKVDIRTFREDQNYVMDVGSLDVRDKRVDAALSAKAAAPEAAAKSEPKAEAKAEPAAAAPAEAPPVAAQAPMTAAPPAAPAPTATASKDPGAGAPVTNAPPASVPAQPAVVPPNAAPADANAPVMAPKPPGEASATEIAPESAPMVSATDEKSSAASPAAAPLGAPVFDESNTVSVDMRRQSDNLKLTFPFKAPTPAAVFRRADMLWLVFDSDAKIDVAALNADPTHTIRSVALSRSGDAQVLLMRLERPRLTSMSAKGLSWIVTVGDTVLEPTTPLVITRNATAAPHANAVIPFDAPHALHRLRDPDVGDTLLVVTALGPARGFLKTQDFVEFSVLASTHGIVIQPLADDLSAQILPDKVTLGRPNGLTLSAVQGASRSNTFRPVVFDPQLWGFDRQADFSERQKKLLDAAAAAADTKRTGPRLDLARFYLAQDMYPEAKGVLDVALSDDRPTAEDTTGVVMRAIADIMLGRPEDGLKDLSNPLVGNQNDAQVWRAVAQAKEGKWADARDGFRNSDSAIATLPIELQRMALKEAVRAALEVRDYAGAADRLNEFEAIGVSKDMEPEISVLTGRLAEGLGRNDEALAAYRAAAKSADRPASAQGKLREVILRYQLGDLKPGEVISELETLTTIWRGDDTEVEALQVLARLYTQETRYRDAFYVMRTAMQAHPNSEMTRRIQDEAAETFNSLFLAGKGNSMPTLDALSLFYDFRELTPIGRRGDEMVRRLAERLVTVDLLDQAAELLQHQVDHRLQGAARAQVATRLAVIYLMDRKPDLTLATLRGTQVTGLSNELRNQRLLIESRALSDIGRHDVALEVVASVPGPEAIRLRSDIYWAAKRWRESAEQIELLYGDRWRNFQPLNDAERADIMRAAIGYALDSDRLGIQRFREKYAAKMSEGPDRRPFDIVTTQFGSGGGELGEIAKSIAAVDTLEAFLRDMRVRFPETGSLTPLPTPTPPPAAAPVPAQGGKPPAPPGLQSQAQPALDRGRIAAR